MKIKIVAVPRGEAPLWVRRGWIGVEIPLPEQEKGGIQMGVLGGRPENEGGYQVDIKSAIGALKKKSPRAAKWWRDNVPLDLASQLVFSRDVCELVS